MHKYLISPAVPAALVAVAFLAAVDTAAAATLLGRLLPVLTFAAGMSVVVNLAAGAGLFGWVAARLNRAGFLFLCAISTVFLSLDTTAIMLTPLAVHLARRRGAPVAGLALAVVWIANLASLPLPVSNLTNLLALDSFPDSRAYIRAALPPGLALITLALIASLLVDAHRLRPATSPTPPPAPPPAVPAIVGITMVALLSPVPYWATSTTAAVAMAVAVGRASLTPALIPWSALSLTLALSASATAALSLGAGVEVSGEWSVAAAGALGANVVNNIPAFFVLEPAVSGPVELLALLIGVNAGAVVTPWASLATLLWADQLRRAGEPVPWRTYVACGLVLAPVAVLGATGVLLVSSP